MPLMRTKKQREKQGDQGRESRQWGVGFDKRRPPRLLLSMQLVPEAEVESLPAGHGRAEPNSNPKLPKPVGRLRFTLNPFSMCLSLLGPKFCRRLSCVLLAAVGVLMVYYMIPVVVANVLTGNIG